MIKKTSSHKYVHSLFLILLIGGCQTAFNLTRLPSEFQSLIACETATVVLTDKSADSSITPSKKYKRSECPECKGKGYIMSGDGLFKQDCPYCEADASFGSVKPSGCNCDGCSCKDCKCTKGKNCQCSNGKDCKEFNTSIGSPQACCKDCICKGNCACSYPGECLVKKNGGRPVKVCDENSCRQYSPPQKTQNTQKPQQTNKKAQPQTKKGTYTYKYSNGQRCTTSGGG